MSIATRFRAYQLEANGSLFSYYKPHHFTLVEARVPKAGLNAIGHELAACGKQVIDTLHITSWDQDHCNYKDLVEILHRYRPSQIQYPAYVPDTDNGRLCRDLIINSNALLPVTRNIEALDAGFYQKLVPADAYGTEDIYYCPDLNSDNKNNRSSMKLFRSGGFSVLSLGDVESPDIAARILRSEAIRKEVDVLVLPHHGADNGFISDDFLKAVKPHIAVSTSDWGNVFGHPKPEVRQMLRNNDVELMTSKEGDVFITQEAGRNTAIAVDFDQNGQHVQKQKEFLPKRVLHLLAEPARFA